MIAPGPRGAAGCVMVPCHVTASLLPVVEPPEAHKHQQGCKWDGLCYLQFPHPTQPREKWCPATARLTVQLRREAAQHSPGKEGHPLSSGCKRFCQRHQNSFGWAANPDWNCCEYYSTEPLQLMSRNCLLVSELLLMNCPAAGHIGRALLIIFNCYLAWKENQNTFLKVIASKTIEEFSTRL